MKKIILYIICLLTACSATFAIKPVKTYPAQPKDYGFNAETKYLKTVDSANIIAWHLPSASNKKNNISIIISSSDAGNMSNWLIVAGNLAHSGFDVWLYDYQGFGKSSDFSIDPDMLYYEEFVNDLSSVVDAVKKAEPKNKICLLGYSMGSIISMRYMQNHPDIVNYYIGDGHVYSPEIVTDRLNKTGESIVLPQMHNRTLDWNAFYAKLQIPVMLFCASEDVVCTQDDIELLKKEIKNLSIIPYTGKHLQGLQSLQGGYFQQIESFLSKK